MSISNLFKPGGLTWRPDANSINAPEGTLLRADNMVPDEDGALSVRRGSRVLYTFPLGTEDVHSLYTYEGSDGYTYRMMGVDSQVYKNPGPGNHTAIWERQYGGEEEKVLNGLFTTNLSSWTVGAGWAWETGGYARHTAGNVLALSQYINVISGTTYHVETTFFGTAAGTVVITLGSVTVTGATGTTGTTHVDIVAAATGFVLLSITPVTAFNGAVDKISVTTDEDDAVSFQFLTQVNYTGGNWEKAYAQTGDVGPVPYTATWEDAYISALVTTLEPVNFNVDFDGTGDIAFGEDHQQCFMARGTTAKKFDGKSFMNWGIAKPNAPAVLTSVSATATSIISCATGEADGEVSAYPIVPGAVVGYYPNTPSANVSSAVATYAPDKNGTANQAIKVVPGREYSTTLGILYKYFTNDPNLVGAKDLSGTDDDIFSVDVYLEDPANVSLISVMLTVAPGDAAYYTTGWEPILGVQQAVRSTTADGASAYEAKVQTILDPIDPKDKPRVNTPEDVKGIIASVGDQNVPSSSSSPGLPIGVWSRFSASRKKFELVGAPGTGFGWNTVAWARILFVTKNGSQGAGIFSDFAMNSSDDGTLTGDYKVVYRWMRETDRYYETSPPSDESNEISLAANQLRVTIPAAAQNGADDQVTDCWVYMFGGFLDTYYRVAVATADPQLTTSIVIDLTTNEVAILTENERLEPYVDVPRDNIIAIAGPWNGRLFTMTSEGYIFPSLQTSPSTFNTYQVIDISNMGDPLWMVKTSSGIHAGCERDVIFLAGTGDEAADRVVIDLYPHPLNIGTPPVDRGVFVDGNSILYRSTDGLIMLASQGLTHVPDDGMRLLWRGQDRHGVSALNVLTGRFRMTVDNKLMYIVAPEGAVAQEGALTVYRLDLKSGQWSRLIYPDPLLSIFNDPNGTTIAGTNNGKLLELEYGTGDAGGVKPTVTIWTPFSDGGNPLVRKDAFDLQLHTDTNGNTGTVAIWKDGAVAAATSYSFSTSQPQAYRIQANGLGTFIRAQLQITGTFDEFQLGSFDLTYRVRAQHMTYLDTGYFQGDDPSDLIWLQEVEVDANSPSNLSVMVYLDDALYTTETVTVTANVRTVYRVPLPRGTKSRRPRIVVKTSAADGAGEIGFDPYFVRVRTRSSGNQAKAGYRTVWPAGQAP